MHAIKYGGCWLIVSLNSLLSKFLTFIIKAAMQQRYTVKYASKNLMFGTMYAQKQTAALARYSNDDRNCRSC